LASPHDHWRGTRGIPLRARRVVQQLGPGLITGAADDDPSGIATYTQAGARYAYGILWTLVLTLPLMIAIQLVSARIGWVTRQGIAANLRTHFPRSVVYVVVGLLGVANTFNLGADLGMMAEVMRLLAGRGSYHLYLGGIAMLSLGLVVWLPFHRYAPVLKFLTLSLLSYAGVVLLVGVPWDALVVGALVPKLQWDRSLVLTVAAVLGTTISPYLFFWQASQEAEEQIARDRNPPHSLQMSALHHLRRIHLDTVLGMTFATGVAMSVMVGAAATLHGAGGQDIATATQAAQALRPIAGDFAFALFSLGIIGAGLLAVPILAGSFAYAFADAMGWRASLADRPEAARAFYGVLAGAFVVGVLLDFNDTDPVRELFWAAILNGVISAPIMAALMLIAQRKSIMGEHVITPSVRVGGWLAVALMTAVTFVLLGTAITDRI
jgi:NRAMP (natural resistance-associated macrophage protein)-like metal ion transporter